MYLNTCIKTEPTTKRDHDCEVCRHEIYHRHETILLCKLMNILFLCSGFAYSYNYLDGNIVFMHISMSERYF